jgi:hypothetical protein
MDTLKLIGMLTKILNELVAAEAARTGLTEDQIVEKSLATIAETDAITDEDSQ